MTISQHPAMPATSPRRPLVLASLGLATAGLLLIGNAFAAGNSDLDAQYQREKAACSNGQSNQDRATCLREAGAAYQQAKQGKLSNGPTTPYNQNALERCKVLPLQDQADCERRIDSPTDVEGSARSGGILRKDVTIVPAPAQ